MHEFLLLEVWVASGGDGFGGRCDGVLGLGGFFASSVVLLFLLEEQVRSLEVLVLRYLVDALLVAITKNLIEPGFGDDCWKHLKVIHEFGQFWEGDFIFGLGVEVKNPLQGVCNSLKHFHALGNFFLIVGILRRKGVEIICRVVFPGVCDDQVVDLCLTDIQLFRCFVH